MIESADEMEDRRRRRSQLLLLEQWRQYRTTYGPRLALIVANSVNLPLRLEDFSADYSVPVEFVWPAELRLAPGLVRPYVGRQTADVLLTCIEGVVGPLRGYIGFHEKAYLGYALVDGVRCCSLLAIAERAEESVLFYLSDPAGVLLVDYCKSPAGGEYSVVVQGDALISQLRHCFAG